MFDLDSHLLSLAEADLIVLHAYQQAERALAVEVPRSTEPDGEDVERNRWIGRLREIDGISRDAIAPIHGRLIALGYLQFQLQGRDAGVVYRMTSEGRNALAAAKGESVAVAPIRKSA